MTPNLFGSKKLDEAFTEINGLKSSINSLKDDIKSLQLIIKKQNDIIKKQQDLLLKNNDDYESIISAVHEQELLLKNEIQEFKTLKISISNELLDNARLQISNSLKRIEEKLALDTSKVDSLSDDFDVLKEQISDLKKSISLVLDAAGKIKSLDLELSDYALVLEKNDKEKLRLLKRIDELETIIARMKRSSSTPYSRHGRRKKL